MKRSSAPHRYKHGTPAVAIVIKSLRYILTIKLSPTLDLNYE